MTPFVHRHIGPNADDTQEILDFLGYSSSTDAVTESDMINLWQ